MKATKRLPKARDYLINSINFFNYAQSYFIITGVNNQLNRDYQTLFILIILIGVEIMFS